MQFLLLELAYVVCRNNTSSAAFLRYALAVMRTKTALARHMLLRKRSQIHSNPLTVVSGRNDTALSVLNNGVIVVSIIGTFK